MSNQNLILWDGECAFCRRTAHWFLRQDKQNVLSAVPYQEAPSPPMTAQLALACEQAVHVVKTDGTILRAGRAALFLLEQTPWKPLAKVLALPPFLWLVEIGYGVIARNRPFFARFFFTKEQPGFPHGD